MRALILSLFLAGCLSPAFGAKRVSVAELEQTLATSHEHTDAEVAQQLSNLELAERLSADRLAKLEAALPGEKARQALIMLADPSAFLDPPANEIPATPSPNPDDQRKILTLTVNYVSQTIHQLPNFFATRVTTSFEDTPSVQSPGAITARGMNSATAYQPLHLVDSSSATVLYREGHEVVDRVVDTDKKQQSEPRTLTTSGVFGPILSTVLVDSARSTLTWSHWEQGPQGVEAVFRYVVPKEKSHYTVSYDSIPNDRGVQLCAFATKTFSQLVAYHGEMAIDPSTGTILRLVIEADLKPDDFTVKSGIVVEYGPVEIGARTYFVPLRSVSSTLAHALGTVADDYEGGCTGIKVTLALKTSLNDVTFGQYHVFRSEATVLSENQAKQLLGQPPVASPEESAAPSAPPAETSASSSTPPAASNSAQAETVPVAVPAPNASASESAPNATPPPAPSSAAPVATSAADSPSTLEQAPLYKSTTRDVVVDVVVTKGNGDPVTGLGKQDFAVAENGTSQTIDFFEDHTANTAATTTPPAMPSLPAGAVTNVPPAPPSDAVNVLLLDSLNTEQQDQTYSHQQIMDFLKKMQPGTRVAIFTLGAKLRFVQGFTADTSVLLDALKRNDLEPQKNGQSRSDAAGDASDISKLQGMRASPYAIEALANAQAHASVRDYSARASMTFEALNYLARYLAGVPGRKNLIWFASSFPVVIFPTVEQRQSIEKNPSLLGYLQQMKQTADLFTVSQISVYPISAEGMMTEHVLEADSSGPGTSSPTGAPRVGSAPDGAMSNGTMSPFVAGASARSGIVDAMQQLAASTGGKTFYNTNDLNTAMQRAIADGAHYYSIGYSPVDKTMDGTYRRIDVKLSDRKYKLSYRHGYNADDHPSLDSKAGANPLVSLLEFGLPSATGVLYGAQAHAGPQQDASPSNRAGENTALTGTVTRYRVEFVIRTEDVDLQPNAQGERSGSLLLGLKAYDREGNAVNWEGDQENLALKESEYATTRTSGIAAHLEIDLPSKMQGGHLVSAVYDRNSGKAGTLEIPLP
jgi:VWFA-related protein